MAHPSPPENAFLNSQINWNTPNPSKPDHATSTPDKLTNFHEDASRLSTSNRQCSISVPSDSIDMAVMSKNPRRRTTIDNLVKHPVQNVRNLLTKDDDLEDPWPESVRKRRRIFELSDRIKDYFSPKPLEPSIDELAKRVKYFFPCRGDLWVQIYDFWDQKTTRTVVRLGDIEKEMSNKPPGVNVRWIHAPLGIGLYHSSIEDIFLNGVGQDGSNAENARRKSVIPNKGKPFYRAGRAGWPYLETELVNIRSFESMRKMREEAQVLKGNKQVRDHLTKQVFHNDRNQYLQGDVRWRAKYLKIEPDFWHTAHSDLPWLPLDGDLNMKSPAAAARETNLSLKRQTIQDHKVYEDAYIVRDSFRCFHRDDGFVLSLSPATGIDFLTQNLQDAIKEQNDRDDHHLDQGLTEVSEEMREDAQSSETSAIAQVFAELKDGWSRWPQKTSEWLMVFLLTEIIVTPHAMRSGYSIPSILDAYDAIVYKLIERSSGPWQRHETVSLVRQYLDAQNELVALGQIFKNKLKFLSRLAEDCKDLESDSEHMPQIQRRGQLELCKTMSERITFATTLLQDLSDQCDQLVKKLTDSMNGLFQLRLIEQNDRAIIADTQTNALFMITAVTSVFLPLSFVTSYFSMSVNGLLRVSSHMTQADFWRICGPFTVGIVTVIWLYVYKEQRRERRRARRR